ncbi:glycosyltransferase family 2 protein [Halomarina oriensis]|uniref:Glycosyltransferase n=1 Tax=Halomarina oriensis TaxID=671145 RepID=A0A6B0GK90_9EURY|nr:glycosyltransferase family 2 protein [Halomarina oriensis]MWG33213.1 glycosyltransferase [Halomarina oriensis]
MYRNNSIGVVVPAYNEAGLVGDVIETIPDYVDRAYVIDDRSTDETWTEIQEAAARVNRRRTEETSIDARATVPLATASESETTLTDGGQNPVGPVVPLRNERNMGRGASVKRGFEHALADDIDVVAMMDGDGQMDPEVLDHLLDPIVEDRADYTKGNRLMAGGGWAGMSRFRLFGNHVLSFLTKFSTGYWAVGDSQNGYAAISSEMLRRLDIDGLYADYGFENDILAKLNLLDARVADVPHPAVYGNETSTIRYETFIPRVSVLLARNFGRRVESKYLRGGFHPIALCYAFAVAALLVGVVSTAYSFVLWAQGSLVPALVSSLALLVGGLLLVAALAFDVRLNAHLAAEAE